MFDPTKSYKFRGGKFVERTAEELTRLEQAKAEQARRAPAKKRIARTDDLFARVTATQAVKLFALDTACWPLFVYLLFERLHASGKAFPLPTRQLSTVKGLSQRNLRRALTQLEGCGLISVQRRSPQLPLLITIPE